jgi:hypothetical protein
MRPNASRRLVHDAGMGKKKRRGTGGWIGVDFDLLFFIQMVFDNVVDFGFRKIDKDADEQNKNQAKADILFT